MTEKQCVPMEQRSKIKSRCISVEQREWILSKIKNRRRKSNEITSTPKLLEKIQIKGQVVTIDVMRTQTAIAEQIRKNRADYVLAVKKNQGNLYKNITSYFGEE